MITLGLNSTAMSCQHPSLELERAAVSTGYKQTGTGH